MKTREFERKVYNINKIVFHATRPNCELHHGRRRVGVRLCCPALFVPGGCNHETNIAFIKRTSEILRPVEKFVIENYVKGNGCKAEIFKNCKLCAMPIIGKGG